MTAKFFLTEKCRGCATSFILDGKYLEPLLDLGAQAVIKFKQTTDEKDDFAPLSLIMCPKCHLVQLSDSVEKDRMFRDYHYLSGVNSSMRASLLDIVKQAESLVDLKDGDLVFDIGSNDGTLLNFYRTYVKKVGFEPAQNISYPVDIYTVRDYFNLKYAERFIHLHSMKPKIITAIAMFYDLEDPNQFCADVKKVLHEDGIFIIQMNYLGAMIKNLTIDNISHEHLCYYSVSTLRPILKRNDLHLIAGQFNDVNGGSMRLIICHPNRVDYFKNILSNLYNISGGIEPLNDPYQVNIERYLSQIETFVDWARQLKKIRADLRAYILSERAAGKTIWGYGASTRGNTLLQWLGFDSSIIEKIADRNPLKHGKFTAGGNIPICSEEEMRSAQPDNLFILAYSFRKEFLERESEYLRAGGSMLFPLPKPEIMTQWTSRFL